MSKKQERIAYIVGVRHALNENGKIGVNGGVEYDISLIKQLLSSLDEVLKLDNITPMK